LAFFVFWRPLDQVAKPAFGHRVLVGKETIIEAKTNLVARLHGSSEDYAVKLTHDCGRNRPLKGNPQMDASFQNVNVPMPQVH